MTENKPSNEKPEQEKTASSAKKSSLKWVILAILIGGFLIGAPYGIQYGIKTALIKAGAQHVELEDVDFNPFSGQLVIKNLKSTTGNEPELLVPTLLIEVDWLPLFSRQILVRQLELQGATLKVEQNEQKQMRIGGILLPEQPAQDKEQQATDWGFGIAQLALSGNTVIFSSPDLTTRSELSDVSLQQLISWSPDQTADFSFSSTLNQAPFSGTIKLNLFERIPRIEGAIKIEQLNLADFAKLGGDAIETLNGKASVDIQFQLKLAQSGISYHQNGLVALQDLKLQTPDLALNEPELRYQGDLSFNQGDAQQVLQTDGKLSSQQLLLNLPSPDLAIAVGETSWSGQFNFTSQPDAPSLNATGTLQTAALDVRKTGAKFESVYLNTLNINDFSLQELADIKASSIQVSQLRVATPDPKQASLLAIEQVSIKQPSLLNQNQIRLDSIDLKGTRSEVRLAKEGGLPLLEQLLASFKTNEDSAEPPASETSEPMQVYIGGVDFGQDNLVNLILETADKPVRKSLNIRKASLGTLDSGSPDTNTPVLLDALIDKHATLSSKGNIKPFTKQLNLDLKTTIKALDLQDLSPLIRPQIGYNINSGQLNANSDLKITKDQIDGKNKLTINNLMVESAKLAATEKLDQQLSMPLDSALDLLRDGDGDIKLDVPLTGDINAPNFELGDIINQAIGGAVKGTTTNFLKLALQPYGLIFMAAEKALEASASISLEPVIFSPGQISLEGKAEDYLQKIAELMAQRPGIRIRVCGYTTEADRMAMQAMSKDDKKEGENKQATTTDATTEEALIELATQRADAIKSHLVEKASISVERLFTCLPKVDEKADAKPRVELLI